MKKMKKLPMVIALLLLFTSIAFAQNDCNEAIVVCGNLGFQDLDVVGVGTQELSGSNTCGSQENNSLWLDVTVNTGGTLGFTLTPTSTAITEDFDFFVFGPNVSCGNIGQAIRCSTTNPQAANQGNNLTGMNASETDTSEGPGPDGNSFVRWLDVNPGERYFIVIDRPIGNSSFDLQWTGSATFNDAPDTAPQGTLLHLEECDTTGDPNDNSTIFDLTVNTPVIIGTQTGISVSYYTSLGNAQTSNSPIQNPAAYQNTSAPQTIFVRIQDNNTGCFTIDDFQLRITGNLDPGTPNNLTACDANGDGVEIFDLTQNNTLIANGVASPTITF